MLSKEDKSIPCEPSLVQTVFRRTLETGSKEEQILARIRPYLEYVTIEDDQLLINQVKLATTTELERITKQKLKSKIVKVNENSIADEKKKSKEES